MLLKPGKLLKAICQRDRFGFTLDEPTQGSLVARLAVGGGGAAQSYCMAFGGARGHQGPGRTDKQRRDRYFQSEERSAGERMLDAVTRTS